MKLHLLGIPHTYTHEKFSCCAFTGKVLRFSPMMQSVGYEVIHYGNHGSESGADEEVMILSPQSYEELGGCEPGDDQYGNSANVGSPLYTAFNEKLALELEKRVEPGDAICLPFGRAHVQALSGPRCQQAYWVETGIGYRNSFAKFRVFESAAWLNVTAGKENPSGVVMGDDYWWVVPNYYEPKDWGMSETYFENCIIYMGRLNEDKGLRVIDEIAQRRPEINFVLYGQGNADWIERKNVKVFPAIHGDASLRASVLGSGAAVITPSRYVEPFGGVAAEALLCGVPVLASAFGAFPEYIHENENGYTSRTLKDWLNAVDAVTIGNGPNWTRMEIQLVARERFSMWEVNQQYDRVFRQIADLGKGGWYSNTEA